MSQQAPPPGQAKPAPRAQQTAAVAGRDLEFLPAALEILETPPPPLQVAFMLTICAFVTVALLWSVIGHLDINAVAPGKIEAVGHTKVVEAVDSSKVAAIKVSQGASVKAGDLLIEFDPADAKADYANAQNALATGLGESARRSEAIDAVAAIYATGGAMAEPLIALSKAPPEVKWDANVSDDARQRETETLKADLMSLARTIDALEKQGAAKQASVTRLQAAVAQDESLLATLTEAADMHKLAYDKGYGSKGDFLSSQIELQKGQSQFESDSGQLKEAEAGLAQNFGEEGKAIGQFISDNQNKRGDAEKRADEARQALAKATAKLEHTKLFAPLDGSVQKLAATTVGQVFSPGQQVMVIAPSNAPLQVEALMPNTDVGFLRVGQEVVVKVDAFPFTRFGTVSGHIVNIAPEAVEEQEAKRRLATAVSSANEATAASGGTPGTPQSFVFPITISLDQTSLLIDGAQVSLAPGMTVLAEARTGERRIISYILSPISQTANEAFKER